MTRQRLVIEGFGCKKGYSVGEIYNFFEYLSSKIKMRILVPPIVVRIPVTNAAEQIRTDTDFGASGTVIWLESGAQIHTWPEHKLATLDVYSCKPYADETVEGCFVEWFAPEKISVGHVKWDKIVEFVDTKQ